MTFMISQLPSSCSISVLRKRINIYIYHILYIIAEAERKLIPTFKKVLTNRISAYLKFRHV